ncbi:AAA family ATPase, partial [Pseudomonas viridiflava]|uniref:AAA family ATPase n=1 Tax=Pseudomonas viridiflava TaxID=33069 RepID=UPI0013DF97B0
MNMITSLEIEDFKCFKNATFQFSPPTVFCGSNSAGKSTALHALLLIKQSYNNGSLAKNRLSLAGDFFS